LSRPSSSAAQALACLSAWLPPSPKENHTSNVDDKGKGDDMGKAKSQGTRKVRNKYKTAMRTLHRSDMLSPATMVDTLSYVNPESGRRKVEWVRRKVNEPRRIVDANRHDVEEFIRKIDHPWPVLPFIGERERPRYFTKPITTKEIIVID
jgi:hypothetical protein